MKYFWIRMKFYNCSVWGLTPPYEITKLFLKFLNNNYHFFSEICINHFKFYLFRVWRLYILVSLENQSNQIPIKHLPSSTDLYRNVFYDSAFLITFKYNYIPSLLCPDQTVLPFWELGTALVKSGMHFACLNRSRPSVGTVIYTNY